MSAVDFGEWAGRCVFWRNDCTIFAGPGTQGEYLCADEGFATRSKRSRQSRIIRGYDNVRSSDNGSGPPWRPSPSWLAFLMSRHSRRRPNRRAPPQSRHRERVWQRPRPRRLVRLCSRFLTNSIHAVIPATGQGFGRTARGGESDPQRLQSHPVCSVPPQHAKRDRLHRVQAQPHTLRASTPLSP